MWTLGPGSEADSPSKCALLSWDVLKECPTEELASLLPQKRILLSCMADSKQDEKLWSLPAPVRSDLPRQSVAVPMEQMPDNPLTTRWVKPCLEAQNIYCFFLLSNPSRSWSLWEENPLLLTVT